MREVNTGNILPFYKAKTLQSETFFNSPVRHSLGGDFFLIPFQIVLPSGGSSLDFKIFNADTGAFTVTITPQIKSTSFFNIYTYFANVDLTAFLSNCQRYEVQVSDSTTSVVLYTSEKIFIKANWKHKLTFTNNTDIGGVMYQTGYTQKVYFDGYEDTKKIDETIGVDIDLNGAENITSYREVTKRVIQGEFIDSQLAAIRRGVKCNTITFIDSNPTLSTAIERYSFNSSPSVTGMNTGIFEIETDLASVSGCGENNYLLI